MGTDGHNRTRSGGSRRPRLQRSTQAVLGPILGILMVACSHAGAVTVAREGPGDGVLGRGIVPSALYVEPHAGFRPVTHAIDRAQDQVLLEAYILTDRRVVRALQRAAAQGVRVNVLLEPQPLGMAAQPQRLAASLRAAGVAVRWTRPGFVFTHAKFFVVDDRLAVVSTANFSAAAFSHNREILVYDRVPEDVLAISNLFRRDWDRLPSDVRRPNLLVAPENARRKIRRLTNGAHHTISIYAEEFNDPEMGRILQEKARKGVRVRILLPASTPPGPLRGLVKDHVSVRTTAAPYIHAKMLSIDGRESYVGSENFSTNSLDHNRELGVLLSGSAVTLLDRVFDGDWKRAVPLTSGM